MNFTQNLGTYKWRFPAFSGVFRQTLWASDSTKENAAMYPNDLAAESPKG